MKRIALILPVLACLSCACSSDGSKDNLGKPDITGTVVFEAAQSGGTSALYAQSTVAGEAINLTGTWKIDDPCRPDLAPDGKTVVFTAREKGKWNIYLYDLATGSLPTCLTADDSDP